MLRRSSAYTIHALSTKRCGCITVFITALTSMIFAATAWGEGEDLIGPQRICCCSTTYGSNGAIETCGFQSSLEECSSIGSAVSDDKCLNAAQNNETKVASNTGNNGNIQCTWPKKYCCNINDAAGTGQCRCAETCNDANNEKMYDRLPSSVALQEDGTYAPAKIIESQEKESSTSLPGTNNTVVIINNSLSTEQTDKSPKASPQSPSGKDNGKNKEDDRPQVGKITEDVLNCQAKLRNDFAITLTSGRKQYSTRDLKDEDSKKKVTVKAEYRGSDNFQKCQTLTKSKWADLVHSKNASTIADSFYNQGWEEAKKEAMRDIAQKVDAVKKASRDCSPDDQDSKDALSSAVAALRSQINSSQVHLQELALKIDRCIGVVPAMDYVKYDDKELIVPQTNMGVVESISSDKKIACKTTGVEVQDYPACKAIVVAYDVAIAAETVMGVVQTYQTQQTISDNYYEYEKDPSNPKAALQAQLNSTKNNRTISDTRAAAYGSKMAIMAGMISSIPNYDTLLKKCEDLYGTSYESPVAVDAKLNGNGFVGQLNQKLTELRNVAGKGGNNTGATEVIFDKNGNDRDAGFCANAIYQGNFNLIQNQRAKDAAIEAAVQAGIDMTKYGLSSALLRDQIRRIKHAMDDIDDYKTADYSVTLDDQKAKYCKLNPNADGCRFMYRSPAESGLLDNTITLQSGGSTSTEVELADDGTYGASNIAPGTQSVNPMGEAVIPQSSSDDFESPPPPPATTKDVYGGGGGGGVGGGGSSGVPSGDNKNANANNGGYYKPQSINYTAGGASVGYTGGKIKNSTEKTNNPLAGLLNKEGATDDANTISTFRNPASLGKKEDDLFQKLSSRYEAVMKQKRLLEYQAVEKKKTSKSNPRSK